MRADSEEPSLRGGFFVSAASAGMPARSPRRLTALERFDTGKGGCTMGPQRQSEIERRLYNRARRWIERSPRCLI